MFHNTNNEEEAHDDVMYYLNKHESSCIPICTVAMSDMQTLRCCNLDTTSCSSAMLLDAIVNATKHAVIKSQCHVCQLHQKKQ